MLIPPYEPVFLLNAVTGAGKTTLAIEKIKSLLSSRPNGTAVYYFVPTHALADEVTEKIQDKLKNDNIVVKSYRGMTAPDPMAGGNLMCRIADDADNLRRGGADISHLCQLTRDGQNVLCPFFHECGWQRQQGPADIYVVPHNLLAFQRAKFLRPPCIIFVDESPVSSLLEGMSGAPKVLSLHDLVMTRHIPARFGSSQIDYDATNELEKIKSVLLKVLDNSPVNEPVKLVDLVEAGITADDAKAARNYTFRRKKKIEIAPDMTAVARKTQVSISKENQRIFLEAQFWDIISEAFDRERDIVPGLRVEIDEKGSSQFKVVRMRWRKRIDQSWRAPTLLMDATSKQQLYTPFWLRIDRTGTFEAAMPHVSCRQVKFSASSLKLKGEGITPSNNRRRIYRYIEARSKEYKSVLVVCQKNIESELNSLRLPNNVNTAHFNGLRGVDKYKEIDCLIVIGRSQPPPDDVEMQAEILFDRIPERGPSWQGSYYPQQKINLCLSPAIRQSFVEMEFHPDANAELVRWSICEAELIQSIGRGRGVNRTEANPLQIDIINTVPLPVQINEVLDWGEAQPSPFDMMLARGILLDCDRSTKGYWNVVAAILPDIFTNKQAAQDWGRTLTMESVNRINTIKESHRESMISAKIKLPNTRYSVPVLISTNGTDPRLFLENVVGRLCNFEIQRKGKIEDDRISFIPSGASAQAISERNQPPEEITTVLKPNFNCSTGCQNKQRTLETKYREICEEMDELEWLDLETAGYKATELWLETICIQRFC